MTQAARRAQLHRAADALHDACIEFARRHAAWTRAGRPDVDLEDERGAEMLAENRLTAE